MSDTNLSHLNKEQLASYDFSQDDRALVRNDETGRALLRGIDAGRLTLDKDGNLKVIDPPQRRDSAFVRFFKRASRANREAYAELDRMEALSKNLSFNQKVASELIARLNNPGEFAGPALNEQEKQEIAGQLTYFKEQLSSAASGQLKLTCAAMIADAEARAHDGPKPGRHLAEGCTLISEAIDAAARFHSECASASSCIEYEYLLRPADEFMQAVLSDHGDNPEALPSTKEVTAGLVLKCLKDPQGMKELLKGTQPGIDNRIDELRRLLDIPKELMQQPVVKLGNLMANLTEAFMKKIGSSAQSRLSQPNADALAQANWIKDAMATAADKDRTAGDLLGVAEHGDDFILVTFEEVMPEAFPAEGAQAGGPVGNAELAAKNREQLKKIQEAAAGLYGKALNYVQCEKILSFCRRNSISAETFFKLADPGTRKTVTDFIGLLSSANSDALKMNDKRMRSQGTPIAGHDPIHENLQAFLLKLQLIKEQLQAEMLPEANVKNPLEMVGRVTAFFDAVIDDARINEKLNTAPFDAVTDDAGINENLKTTARTARELNSLLSEAALTNVDFDNPSPFLRDLRSTAAVIANTRRNQQTYGAEFVKDLSSLLSAYALTAAGERQGICSVPEPLGREEQTPSGMSTAVLLWAHGLQVGTVARQCAYYKTGPFDDRPAVYGQLLQEFNGSLYDKLDLYQAELKRGSKSRLESFIKDSLARSR